MIVWIPPLIAIESQHRTRPAEWPSWDAGMPGWSQTQLSQLAGDARPPARPMGSVMWEARHRLAESSQLELAIGPGQFGIRQLSQAIRGGGSLDAPKGNFNYDTNAWRMWEISKFGKDARQRNIEICLVKSASTSVALLKLGSETLGRN